jgi:putative membrane protein
MPSKLMIERAAEGTAMLTNILVTIVAAIHVYIVILEMLLWEKPAGRKAFGTTAEFAKATRVLAANQGLYNGFLVAGLVWGLLIGPEGFAIKLFFLACVLVAGLFGAATASRKILYVQALPAALALAALFMRL